MNGHVVSLPDGRPHRTLRLVHRRRSAPGPHDRQREAEPAHDRVEPPPSRAACERCQEAYAETRRTIEQAGGIAKWMALVTA